MVKFETFKSIGFVLLIVLVFSPLTFLVTNTLSDNVIGDFEKDCYRFEPASVENNTYGGEKYVPNYECEKEQTEFREKRNTFEFTTIAIINLIVIIAILIGTKTINPVISYSLFFSAGLNTFIMLIKYNRIKSLLGITFGIILFILTLVFINKDLKKK